MRKLGILADDIELINNFKQSSSFEEVIILNESNIKTEAIDIVLVSDRKYAISNLKNLAGLMNWQKCFYMVSGKNFSNLTRALVESDVVTMIPPKLTIDQIVDFVYQRIHKNSISKNKLFTFFGADSKVGTTMIAQSTAELLAKVSNRVIYLPLDGTVGDDYCQFDNKFGLNDIKTKLQTKILSRNELEDICVESKAGYDVLPGIKSILSRRQFHPEDVAYLLKLIKKLYEVVIIDTGSDIELGTAIAGLNATPNRILVTSQQSVAYKRFRNLKNQILDLVGIESYLIVINKYVDNPSLEDSRKMESNFGGTLVTTVPFIEYGWQCEQEQRSLLSTKDDQFTESIESIVEVITSHLDIPFSKSVKRKKSFFSRLFIS